MSMPVYDSARRPSPVLEELLEAWRYRDLIVQMVHRDLVMRYKRSILGVAWTMLYPLGMMIVLTLAFSHVFGGRRGYAAYVVIGLVAWQFFSQTTVAAMRQLVWGGDLIRRIYVPKTTFAIAAVGWGLVNLVLSLVPLGVVTWALGVPPGPAVLVLPLAIALLAAFALGVGLLLSTFAALFPDVAEAYEIALMAWMYLTPIIYPEEIVPVERRWWLFGLNPLYHLIKVFRAPLYDGVAPPPGELGLAAVIALATLVLGWIVFTRKADECAYLV